MSKVSWMAPILLGGLVLSGAGRETERRDEAGRENEHEDEDVGSGPDRGIARIVARVEADQIEETVVRLEEFGTRHSCSPDANHRGVNAARDWIFQRFSAIEGLRVGLDPFVHPRCKTASTSNVVAWLPGAEHPERLVIIGGHYDSRTIDVDDGLSDAPGANDAGAQSALVLEAARVLSKSSHDATLVFITFSGEEQGLFGSAAIARNLSARLLAICPDCSYFARPTVVAMLNADIPGGDNVVNTKDDLMKFRLYSPGTPRERFARVEDGRTDNTSPSRGLMRYIGTWGAAYVPSMQMIPKLREDRPGRGSDHASFIAQGFPAVRFMETFECSPSPADNSCAAPRPLKTSCPAPPQVGARSNGACLAFATSHQHSPADRSEFVTPSYAGRIAQVMVATAASLARAPGAPQWAPPVLVEGTNPAVVGDSKQGATLSWSRPATGDVDHYVIAARSTTEPFYRQRVVTESTVRSVSPSELGLAAGGSFFISVASVDDEGHESLFAYPEFRCDATGCVVPSGALNVTASAPNPPLPP